MTEPATETAAPGLFPSERHREIVALTVDKARVEVAELAKRFGVTTETIRRDLSDLQRLRLVRRVHGGAVPWDTASFEPLLSIRNDQHDGEKRRLARAAIEELPPDGSIIIDSGSTLNRFAEAIPTDADLRVVTNSLATAQALASHDRVDVVVIGGKLRKNTLAMVDSAAVEAVRPLTVDALFISCDGMSVENGLSTPYRAEAALKRAMIASADRVIALADHSKFGHDFFMAFADWADIDVLVTNRELAPASIAAVEACGVTVLVC